MKAIIIFVAVVYFLISSNTRLFAGGWTLMQNSPTTNDLHSVYFLDDNTGWIAGNNSTIYKTTNSGESWIQQTSPEASNFQCITFVNDDTGWACGTGGTVIKTTNGGTNWISQSFTGSKFNSMYFIDADSGYITGAFENIYKTTNGGSSWIVQRTGQNSNFYKIEFTNSTTGFVVGDLDLIYKTSNGGHDWILKSGASFLGQIYYTIGDHFKDDGNIFTTGTITKYSTDDGESWNLGGFPTEPIFSLADLGAYRYLGVGGNGYIVETSDEGITWTQEQSPTAQNLYSAHYPDFSNYIWTVGANGTILKYIPNWKYASDPFRNYKDVDFINQNTGWTVSGSYIAKTTNSGTDWTAQTSGTTAGLYSVYFTNASTGYTVGSSGTILKTTDGGTNWTLQTSGISELLSSVYFIDANLGYVVGLTGTILKTTNGGTNWTLQSSGTNYSLSDVFFTDADNGTAVGGSVTLGIILRTTNGGTNWTTQASGTIESLSSVYFLDGNTGWVVGWNGAILHTTDGGTNWRVQNLDTTNNFNSVYFIDSNVGYIGGERSIYKTNNGGNNWFEDDVPGRFWGLNNIQIVVENNTAVGFAAGQGVLRTSFEYLGGEPGGNSGSYPGWVQVNSGTTTGFISSVDYINPFVAFGVGGPNDLGSETGMILRTINGGQTWTRQQSNVTNGYFTDVSFADVNNGIAVGLYDKIAHTTNAGLDWVLQSTGTNSSIERVDMLDINNAFACVGSLMLHTSDGGLNWENRSNGVSGYFWGLDYINSTTATAVGWFGKIIRTTDAGLNWFEQTGGGNLNLSGVKFIDVNNGIAISNEGPVLRTTNGGTNWTQTVTLSGFGADISYSDSNTVFIVTQSGGVSWVYISTDGGLTWMLQTTVNGSCSSVSFADANNGLISGTAGLVLRTSNGGFISGTNSAYNRNGLNLPIGDFQNTDDSINVNITYNPSANAVTRVYVTIDTVLHTNDGDLEFYLEHNGITDTLIYQNGEGGENFLGTFLNDETNFPLVSGTAPFRGSFEPYRPLSKFNGQDPSGSWKLRIFDGASGNTGTLNAWSLTLLYQTATDVTDDHQIPSQYLLSQNYPNPFNPSTTIRYGLTQQLLVSIKIFNILGQEVATLVNEEKPAGSYEANFNARKLSSGIYFYRIQAGSFVETKKMILLR